MQLCPGICLVYACPLHYTVKSTLLYEHRSTTCFKLYLLNQIFPSLSKHNLKERHCCFITIFSVTYKLYNTVKENHMQDVNSSVQHCSALHGIYLEEPTVKWKGKTEWKEYFA